MTNYKADSLTPHFNSIASQGIHITRPYFIKAKPVKKEVYVKILNISRPSIGFSVSR